MAQVAAPGGGLTLKTFRWKGVTLYYDAKGNVYLPDGEPLKGGHYTPKHTEQSANALGGRGGPQTVTVNAKFDYHGSGDSHLDVRGGQIVAVYPDQPGRVTGYDPNGTPRRAPNIPGKVDVLWDGSKPKSGNAPSGGVSNPTGNGKGESAPAPASGPTSNPTTHTSTAGGSASDGTTSTDIPSSDGVTLAQFMAAIRHVESGSDYAWKSNKQGATGAYQILASNWPSWAQEAGVNPADHSPAAQDKVAAYKMAQYLREFGSWSGVAAAWLGGEGGANTWLSGKGDPADANGTTISQYVSEVLNAAGGYTPDQPGGGGAIPGGNSTSPTGSDSAYQSAQVSKEQFDQGLQQSGFSEALINSDPQLKQTYQDAVTQNWTTDRFLAAVQNTEWWKARTGSQRVFDEAMADPTRTKSLLSQIASVKQSVLNAAGAAGIALQDYQAENIARLSVRNNLSADQLQHTIADYWKPAAGQATESGSAAATINTIDQYADAYQIPMTQTYKNELTRRVLAGEVSAAAVKDELQQQAEKKWYWLTDQLQQGKTVRDIADPFMAEMANVLELPESSISMNDPLIKQALQSPTQDGKGYTTMPAWQFDTLLRQDPRWKQTSNYANTNAAAAMAFQRTLGG